MEALAVTNLSDRFNGLLDRAAIVAEIARLVAT